MAIWNWEKNIQPKPSHLIRIWSPSVTSQQNGWCQKWTRIHCTYLADTPVSLGWSQLWYAELISLVSHYVAFLCNWQGAHWDLERFLRPLKAALLLFKCLLAACSAPRAQQQHTWGCPLLFLYPDGALRGLREAQRWAFVSVNSAAVFSARVSCWHWLLRVHLCRTTGTQLCICAEIPISCSSAKLFILPPVYSAEVREHKVSWNKPAGWSLTSGGEKIFQLSGREVQPRETETLARKHF